MGYELHISRTEEYYDSEERPIALDEWLSYAASNPTLRVGERLGWDGDRQPIYEYPCMDGSLVSLTWLEGAIEIKEHFDGDAYHEFGSIAEDLQASLQGDDGEWYRGERCATATPAMVMGPCPPRRYRVFIRRRGRSRWWLRRGRLPLRA